MNKFLKSAASAAVLASLALSMDASAQVVTALDGTALTMPTLRYMGAEAQTLAPGITWSADSNVAVFGYTVQYGLDTNGTWSTTPYVGVNSDSNTMTFRFDQAVAGFGGVFNYAPGYATAPVIAAYDAGGKLLDSFTLAISTPDSENAGQFYGFLDQTADISTFTMTGSYMVGRDFIMQNNANNVPEPASLCLLGLGLAGVGVVRRKSAKR